jgi:hypothetical protein
MRVHSFAAQHGQRLRTILRNAESMQQLSLAEGFDDEPYIARIILDQEDLERSGTGARSQFQALSSGSLPLAAKVALNLRFAQGTRW